MAEWSDLPMDFVRVVADLLLATSDVDAYLDIRSVCHNWRVAIPKPTPLGAGDDLRFRPRDWVMLDLDQPRDGGNDDRLFLHLSTGRFLRRRIPLLFGYGNYTLLGASDGLLVLACVKAGLHTAMLVNPFTRDMLPFAAPIPQEKSLRIAAAAGINPNLFFSFQDWRIDIVYCADATSQLWPVQFKSWEGDDFFFKSVVSYAGDLYVVDLDGKLLKIVGTAPDYHDELIDKSLDDDILYYDELTEKYLDNDPVQLFLVVSDGELLLVKLKLMKPNRMCVRGTEKESIQVYRVNLGRKMLEPVTNIGSRALFLADRCLSLDVDGNWPNKSLVDGNWLNSLDRNCIYYSIDGYSADHINRYDLSNNNVETISCMFPGTTILSPLLRRSSWNTASAFPT
uniref:Uncharacterized protein n=1 Tax=Avena sativa TaxID=4498 RepID=A0ACD5XWW4_AVESA